MKKFFKLFWQILIPIVLFIPYRLLNQFIIVKWLGGNGLVIDSSGQAYKTFSANSFSACFWSVIGLIVIVITIINLKQISKLYRKIIYLSGCSILILYLVYFFYHSMLWK